MQKNTINILCKSRAGVSVRCQSLVKSTESRAPHIISECMSFCSWSKILQTIRVRLPHSPLMNPIEEGGGAAWASLYINVLCSRSIKNTGALIVILQLSRGCLPMAVSLLALWSQFQKCYWHRGLHTAVSLTLLGHGELKETNYQISGALPQQVCARLHTGRHALHTYSKSAWLYICKQMSTQASVHNLFSMRSQRSIALLFLQLSFLAAHTLHGCHDCWVMVM